MTAILWWMQQQTRATCRHDFGALRIDGRTIDTEGNQYELEMCRRCYDIRRGALVKEAGKQ